MRLTFRLSAVGFAAAVLLNACGGGAEDRKVTPEEEAAALNAAPQKQYPELTLEAQNAAMERLEEMRRKNRVERLRDRTPPAEWIQVAYHGLVLDANLDVIEMDPETIRKMQESIFSILKPAARERAITRFGGDVTKLFNDQQLKSEEKLVVRAAALDALIAESDPALRARYEWRLRLIQGAANTQIDSDRFVIRPQVRNMLRQFRLLDDVDAPPPSSSAYVERCRAEGVPIPPDWPDSRWISQGTLGLVFIGAGLTAEVNAYKDPAVPGVCYALPRRDSSGSVEFLGIICQSEPTGKTCFWDNRSVDNVKLTGVGLTLDIDTIGNGFTLGETCTDCHRGFNAFTIHPGTALDLSRAAAVGGPYTTDPAVRFAPIGQAHWSNPGPLVLPSPPPGQSSCTVCHELPQTAGAPYCSTVLQSAAMTTMPPLGANRAGWPGTSVPVNVRYTDHITQLSTCP